MRRPGDSSSRASHPPVSLLPMRVRTVLPAIVVVMALTLVACAAQEPPPVNASSRPLPSASPSPTVKTQPTVFSQPTTCAEALPLARIVELEGARRLVLLGGPEGRYGLEYALDPSPEERAGGVTCIWGDGATDISVVTVSVAPVSAASRVPILAQLTDQGLNETIEDDAVVYWQQGDTDEQPAIVNVVRDDSWISVIQTTGGTDSYEEAVVIADEAHAAVYG